MLYRFFCYVQVDGNVDELISHQLEYVLPRCQEENSHEHLNNNHFGFSFLSDLSKSMPNAKISRQVPNMFKMYFIYLFN